MNINITAEKQNTYDAIVIGSGISGGWAAMELCRKGLKTLLLERGRDVQHIKDYPTAMLNPWDFEYRLEHTLKDLVNNPIQSQASDESCKAFFANDVDHPYIQDKPFNWNRGYQVGGRSLTWGRQCYRWSDLDFEANLKDGTAVDWPIRYKDLAPWYDYVESFIGVSGDHNNLSQLPDGRFLPGMELNIIEKHLAQSLKKNSDVRELIIARVANLSQVWDNRGPCQNRNLCHRGCPFGGYFSSNSSTIPAAVKTGNLTLRPFSVVTELVYDDKTQKVSGVRVVDTNTHEHLEFHSKVVFVNAATIPTTSILLNSKSARYPNGLGNDSGELGHNLMDHHSSAGAVGTFEGFKEYYYKGRRPCGFLIPRYRNLKTSEKNDFLRGYNIQGKGARLGYMDIANSIPGFGKDFKEQLTKPGSWSVWMAGWGECLPYHDNQISLDDTVKDQWGQPVVHIDFSFRDNEKKMMKDIRETSVEILQQAGFNAGGFNYETPGGSTVHEMGTARMGHDAKTSVLNKFNQLHNVKNVFVTDGSSMTSSACQNPSLTYMALTARAAQYAFDQLKAGSI